MNYSIKTKNTKKYNYKKRLPKHLQQTCKKTFQRKTLKKEKNLAKTQEHVGDTVTSSGSMMQRGRTRGQFVRS